MPGPTKAAKKRAAASSAKTSQDSTESATDQFAQLKVTSRSVVGTLTSRETSRDIKVEALTLTFHGRELLSNTTLEINFGRRYGLIGSNGCGKSTFLECIANRELPIPEHIDVFHLSEEVAPSERTALQTVIDEAEKEVKRLEAEEERLLTEMGPESEELQDLYDRLERLDPTTFIARASEILIGLGFNKNTMHKLTKDLSGGWRMRVSLAKALFVRPTLLLLDEPTNHLDLHACVWLEEYLKNYNHSLIVISHSQDFLNNVCTNIMHMRQAKLMYYGGNYDTFVKTKSELEQNQMKAYTKQQEEIQHIKTFISSCGTYSNLVRQAKSRQKILDKMEAAGLVEKVVEDFRFHFRFPDCGTIPPPVLQFHDVGFSYSGDNKNELYSKLSFAVDLDSRIALVGPNGAGKSTLLKLMVGDLTATKGQVTLHSHCKVGRYHQHSAEAMDMTATPLDFVRRLFPNIKQDEEEWRRDIGRYGITGRMQVEPIGTMSDGLKSRLCFGIIAMQNPHMLLLDEPTNHLDMEMIDSLAEAINAFQGGLVLVSHDFRLISQVAKEIWICDHKTIAPHKGDIQSYKQSLRTELKLA